MRQNEHLEQWTNSESKEQRVGKSIKKATWALALTIALWTNPANAKIVNDLKSYEDACLNSVAGEKVTILVPEDFFNNHKREILKTIPEEDTCEIKWYNKETGLVNFPVVEKNGKKYFQISFKAVDWGEMDASDIVAEKERQVAEKERQVAEKERQVAELEKMVKAEWYLWYLQDKVILIWKNVDNRKLVLNTLDEILKNLKIRNLKWDEYGEQIWRVLKQVRKIYEIKWDTIIPKKIDKLLKKLNLN